jgi:hypothetical protein
LLLNRYAFKILREQQKERGERVRFVIPFAFIMAWGKSTPPPTESAISKVAPLLIFFVFVGVIAAVLLQVAKTASDIADNAGKKLEKKNVLVTKGGVKVGVKEVGNEKYVDRTQRCANSFLIHLLLSTSPAGQCARLGDEGC